MREGDQLFQSAARARTRWIRDGWAESKQARVERPPVEETEDAELRSLTDVAMVQAADFGKLHDPPRRGNSIGLRSGASLSSARWVRA